MMSLWMLTLTFFSLLILMLCPFPPFGNKCLHCGKHRPPLHWLCSLDNEYCDDCLDMMNEEIRNTRTR